MNFIYLLLILRNVEFVNLRERDFQLESTSNALKIQYATKKSMISEEIA